MRSSTPNMRMKKKPADRKVLRYTAIFEAAKEGGYVVYFPALPGCLTQGNTFEKAQENAQEIATGYLKALRKEGEEIPMETYGPIFTTVEVTTNVR